jgi:hypothetical protein
VVRQKQSNEVLDGSRGVANGECYLLRRHALRSALQTIVPGGEVDIVGSP